MLLRWHIVIPLFLALAIALPNTHRTVVEDLLAIPEGWVQGNPPSPETSVRMNLAVSQQNTRTFEQIVLDISTPGHRNYGKHLSRRDLKGLLRPRRETSNLILSWLEESGVPKRSIVDDGDWIHFVISISKAERMLQTQFYYFHDAQDPGISMIRTLKYSIPSHLARHVYMIQPTTKFGKPKKHANSIANLQAIYLSCNATLYAPEMKGANFSVVHIGSGLNLQNSTRNSIEASLDIDYALGLSNASAVFYTTSGRGPLVPDLDQPDQEHNSNEPYLDQLHYLLSLPQEALPAVLSTSYGENEQSVPERFSHATCNLFAQLGARGVSVIFSSGDSGVGSSCLTNGKKNVTRFNPTFPASCPFVTSVGATFKINPERAIEFSSGGFSDRHSRPRYQNDAVQHYLDKLGDRWKGLYNPKGRGIPDVSAQGANFAIYDHGKVMIVSGTSASAPAFAAIIANLNAIRLRANKPVLGYLNPFIYGKGREGFTDIVHGGSKGSTPAVLYASWNATEGWDPVTGVGTPNFRRLAKIVQHME
ncbi:tripeptidyl peptidase SED3 [Trichophyton equinum CBS 127.97]|uniref:tripeptidyl-peptidase II n=1 Tax=Trichophyton equinum (strain ATCC MYA-4606 / CBS 127.97) TaxID=559882 RepID=F2Q1D3_TRIEC|nr:tripeptidyl peptidase SED3 [Trichophyton equinum CBS 127.97]